MRRGRVTALGRVAAIAHAACPPAPADGALPPAGQVSLAWRADPAPITRDQPFALLLTLCPVRAALTVVDCTMPEHRHGTNCKHGQQPLGVGAHTHRSPSRRPRAGRRRRSPSARRPLQPAWSTPRRRCRRTAHGDDTPRRAQDRNFGEILVPGLRQPVHTAPYLHDGRLATVEDVARRHSELDDERLHADGERIRRENRLNAAQAKDLAALLRSLSSGGR